MVFRYLENLPPPQIYEDIQHARMIASVENILRTEIPDVDLSIPSTASQIVDVLTGYMYTKLQKDKADFLSQLIRYATGANLDNIGAWFGEDGVRRDGESDAIYKERLLLLNQITNTATEAGIQSNLRTEFQSTLSDVTAVPNYDSGVNDIYTLTRYRREQAVADLLQPAPLRQTYLEFLNMDDNLILGQRFAVKQENLIQYVLQVRVTYFASEVNLDNLKQGLTVALDNFIQQNFVLGGSIRLGGSGGLNRVLAIQGVENLEITALHEVGSAGVGDLLSSSKAIPKSVTYVTFREDDIAEEFTNGVHFTFNGISR